MGTNWAWRTDQQADSDADELTLVGQAQTQPEAFGPLYQRYLPRIYRYVRARSASDDEAADLTQQVFLNALAALPQYRLNGPPFPVWLFRIARNLLIDASRRKRPAIPWEATPTGLPADHDVDLEADLIRQESLEHLRLLLSQLDQKTRDLLALRFAAGLSSREIAGVVGKREAAVKKQLARTIRRLKEQYDAESPAE